jgi:CheY-like chemotaxis protein
MPESCKVLVVDDDGNTRTAISDLLAEAGYTVVVAADGEEAIEKATEKRPDVIMLDTRLPGMDGYEVCKRIKEIKGLATKVIMYTAYVDAVNVARAKEVGADDFIAKTSDFATLREAIENLK